MEVGWWPFYYAIVLHGVVWCNYVFVLDTGHFYVGQLCLFYTRWSGVMHKARPFRVHKELNVNVSLEQTLDTINTGPSSMNKELILTFNTYYMYADYLE